MNHDFIHKANRLRGLALQIERGEVDRDFAESAVPIAERRDLIVQRMRDLAAELERAP